jgi:hypothetical protein
VQILSYRPFFVSANSKEGTVAPHCSGSQVPRLLFSNTQRARSYLDQILDVGRMQNSTGTKSFEIFTKLLRIVKICIVQIQEDTFQGLSPAICAEVFNQIKRNVITEEYATDTRLLTWRQRAFLKHDAESLGEITVQRSP